MSNPLPLKAIIEAALFAADEPLNIAKLLSLFDEDETKPTAQDIQTTLESLQQQYGDQGVALKELASGWQFQVQQHLAPWVKRLWKITAPRYSRALMETLALIAYRQPITRAEIEEVRGVTVSSQIIKTLEQHGWIRQVGHKDSPGRPALFASSKQFLDHFGMKSLNELPPLAELKDLSALENKLEPQLMSDKVKE